MSDCSCRQMRAVGVAGKVSEDTCSAYIKLQKENMQEWEVSLWTIHQTWAMYSKSDTSSAVLDSDSSYEDSLGRLVLVILPTNDYHCVG